MKRKKIYLLINLVIEIIFLLVVSIIVKYLPGVIFFITILFILVVLLKRELSKIKKSEVKKSIDKSSSSEDRNINVIAEDIIPEEKPEIDNEQYRNFAKLAAQRVIKETEIPSMIIYLDDETTSIFDSKAGGLPYLSKDFNVPLDSNGEQMKLLSQIDCHDLKGLNDYPHEGILQFWMTTKWSWDEAKVIYHKEVDSNITEEEVIQKIDDFNEDDKHCFPVYGSYRMKFELSSESISRYDKRLKALFCQYFTEISGEYISDPEDAESEEVYNVFEHDCDERDNAFDDLHKVSGYRYTTQFDYYDVYKEGEKIDIYSDDADALLFQLTSIWTLTRLDKSNVV